MRTVTDLNLLSTVDTVVALGCFDGVHMGHREVIRTAKAQAIRLGLPLAVLTFAQPPKNYFIPHSVPLLTDSKTKESLIEKLGVDLFLCVPFDQTVADMPSEEFFFEILIRRMRAAHIVCGFNYSFGAGGRGNADLLGNLAAKNNIGLSILSPVTIDGIPVSSSAIRSAIVDGRVEEATLLLGRPYTLCASVIDGQKLARSLGFPTLNQRFPKDVVVPRHGVYAVQVTTEDGGTVLDGIANVGVRPTVGGDEVWSETHIFNFDGDLYGKRVSVAFRSFLRPERKFNSLDALREQIQKDILLAKELLS
ncbi:MAG: bifunctional riboflavin kinase/FAD synthetase [Clostridia bacterium]|nr:bifunctional riboflavin kinase/FAD synthetase [Clostridia bacterium]